MKKFLLSILCLVAVALTGYAAEATVTFSELGYVNAQDLTTVTVDENITLTFDAGGNSNSPKYYTTGSAARLYPKNSMTITASNGCIIESVVINTTSTSNTFQDGTTVTNGTYTLDGTVATIANVNNTTTTITHNINGTSGHARVSSVVVTYTAAAASSVATPTFTVEPDTYGTKQSVGIECATDGAVIYYTLDGNTPDKTSTLYEAPIELNSKTTVKAIAYVDEEASNVATATYDFKLDCVLTWNTNSPFIQATTGSAKTQFVSPLGNTGANYWVTYDGSEPSAENGTKKYPANSLMMSTIKKDTIFTMKVRPEKDGIYGETLEGTFYIGYQSSLTLYKTVSEMAAGNYVIAGENTVMLPVDGGKNTYGYGYTADAAVSNGLVSAFGYFEFAFEAADGGYYIKDSKGQYLYGDGEHTSFQLSTTVPTSGGVWSVELQANGQAKITNATTGDWIQWNSNYKNWAMYNKEQNTFMPTLAVAYQPTVTITPAANNSVESLDKIILTCSDGIKNNKTHYCSVQGAGVTVNVTANQVDDNTLELVLDSPITKSGDYTFIFYKEAVILAPNSAAIKYPAVTENINYTIGGGAEPLELVVTPANESVNKSLQNFTFSCEQGISINGLFGGQAPFLGFTDPTTGTSSQIALTPGASTETSVTLSTEKAQTTEGYYTLVVPAEYFVLADAQPNEAIMYQYIVSATNPNAINIKSVTPEEGNVTELKQIIVMCDVEIDMAPSTWTITDAKGNVYPAQYTSPANLGFMGIQIDLKEAITAEGTYTLNIPAGSIVEYLGSKQIEEQTITWTIGGTVETPDYIFNAEDYEVDAEYTTLTDGIFTFLQGDGSTKPWIFDANGKTFSNGHVATKRIKPQTDKNYLTADVPAAGKLVFGVLSSSSSATNRTLSVKQNDVELYGKVVCDSTDKVDGVYTVHEVAVEAGLATITMAGAMNFYYIEFVPAGDAPATIEFLSVTPQEGTVSSLLNIQVITDTDLGEANGLTLTDADGKEYSLDVAPNDRVGEDGIYESIIITLKEEITAAGTYTLTIPAGKVVEYIEDMATQTPKLNAEKTYTWTIDANDGLAIVSTTPAEGETVDYIYEVNVEVSEPVYLDSFNGAQPYLLNADGEKVATFGVDYPNYTGFHQGTLGKFYLSKNLLFFLSSPIKDAGNYQIVIPANSFKTDDDAQSLPETIINVTIEAQEALAVVSSENTDKGITIKFNKEIQVISGLYGGGQFVVYDQWGMNYGACSVSVNDDKTSLYAEFSETLVPESYKIVIPDNTVKTVDGSETLAATTVNFTVSEAAPAITATWSIEEYATIESFTDVTVTFAGEGIESVRSLNMYEYWFYEKDADGNYNLTTTTNGSDGILDRSASGTTITLSADPSIYSNDFMSPFNRKGDYRIVIPAGGVYFNGDKANANTEEYVLNFTIYNDIVELEEIDATFVADPENNSTISEIKEIVITFPEYETVAVGEPDMMMGSNIPTVSMVDDFTGAAMPAGYIMFRAGDAANQLLLYVDPAYTGGMDSYAAEGQYVINIPANIVTFSDGVNKAFQLNYTVGAEALAIVSSTPAEGAEVESFSEMVVEFNKPVWFTSFGNAKLQDADGATVATLSHEMVDPTSERPLGLGGTTPVSNKVRFYTDNAITTDGSYSVVIAKETFGTDESDVEYSEKMTINFSVKYVAPSAIELVATDPAEGATISASEFESILTTWNMNIDMTYDGAEAYLLDAEGNRVATANGSYVFDASHICIDNQLNFVFNTPITNAMGTYTFVIEAGYIYDMGTYSLRNEEIRITFELNQTDGIKGIEMDPVHGYVVYDFSGILVMQTRNAADLERLNNGLYIINGVKILINK